MSASTLLLCILASLLELDTTYAFQTLISRPIIAGPIFGLITGDVMAGVQVGIFTELLFSDISPLGGIIPPSGIVACVIPLVLYSLGIELYFGFFLGVLSAIAYSFLDTLMRKTRFKWIVFLEKGIERHPGNIKQVIAMTLLAAFLMTFIFLSVTTWISSWLIFRILPYIPPRIHLAFLLAYTAVPWIGLASMLPAFRLKAR